ncbi:MAG TPA: ATP-binding protein [Kofleriaceae bacterium]|nr:ATP-binding protein [Kofleriaceae bacterium]
MRVLLFALAPETQNLAKKAVGARADVAVTALGLRDVTDRLADDSFDVVLVDHQTDRLNAELSEALRRVPCCRDALLLALVSQAHARKAALEPGGPDDFFVLELGVTSLQQRLDIYRRWQRARLGRKRAEEDRERFFELAFDLFCIANRKGQFERVNAAWTRILGWTAEELYAMPSLTLIHPEDLSRTIDAARTLLETGTLATYANRYRAKDGSYRWFEWHAVVHGSQQYFHATARDITEQMQAHEERERMAKQLILADRLASVGTLAAGVAHEINNPLSAVVGNLDLITEELSPIADQLAPERLAELRALIADAHAGAERVRKIVLGLKTFSRAEQERRTVLDVQQVLELSISMTNNEIRHRARLVKDYRSVPVVLADEARLGQVFINLLINAAHAIPEGNAEANEIRVRTSTDDRGRAVIEVIDTGSGISEATLARIFDPFFTTKPVGQGVGLGLSICHTIVTALGGTITAASEPGAGTTFRIVLPAAVRVERAAPRPLPIAVRTRRATVLVVDDEAIVGITLTRLLREHEITYVARAREALDLIAAGKRYDVIVSDLMMPEMSGMDFYDELRRDHPELVDRVVFVTGGAFTSAAHAFLDSIPNVRLEKPFDAKTIRETLKQFVDEPQR